jgi:hypothetical protein
VTSFAEHTRVNVHQGEPLRRHQWQDFIDKGVVASASRFIALGGCIKQRMSKVEGVGEKEEKVVVGTSPSEVWIPPYYSWRDPRQ